MHEIPPRGMCSRSRERFRGPDPAFNQIGKIILDIVTLIRYTLGTVKNCESGPSACSGRAAPPGVRPFFIGVKVPRKKQLTLVAARKPQLKKRAKRDWSKAKARAFLEALADTCNVSEACRQSGVPMTVAYRLRKMEA